MWKGGAELKCYPSVGTTVHAQVVGLVCVCVVCLSALMCNLSVHSVKGGEGGGEGGSEGGRRGV